VLAVPRRQARAAAAGPDRPKLLPRSKPIEGEPPASPVAGRGPLLAIIGAVVVVLLVIFSGIWWATAGPGSYLDAPSVVGRRQADAERALTEQGLTSRIALAYSAKIAAGQVISTAPAGGTRLRKKGTMVLTVSKGPQLFAVPDVSGKSVDDATAAIKKAHLAVGDSTTAYNAAVSPGQVISTSPKSGTKLVSGRKVDLVIARAATIRGVNSGRCLDVPNGSQNDGTQTVLQDCTGSASQSWVATPAQQLTVFNGTKCLDVAGGATNDGAVVQIYTCNGGTNQQWVINADGSILGVGSGKCLDATDHGTDNGTPMQLWDCTGGDNQKWSR
jgi:hypothetical protein